MRYLIKFTKESNIKFISHLDLMRTLQKIVRRADLPMEYSKGFNPHMAMSIAQPLSVGVYSQGEYMDLVLSDEVDEKEMIEKLNSKSASGIKFIQAKKIVNVEGEKKAPQAMALIDACRYIIKVSYENTSNLEKEIENLLKDNDWTTIKKSKKGERCRHPVGCIRRRSIQRESQPGLPDYRSEYTHIPCRNQNRQQ